MSRLTYSLLLISWFMAVVITAVIFWQWPASAEGCRKYNCTYIPTPYPGCYYIVTTGSNQTIHRSCQICQPRVNGTACYNESGFQDCPSEATCYNVYHVLGRWIFFSLGICVLFLGLMLIVETYHTFKNPERIPLIIMADGQPLDRVYPGNSTKTDYRPMNWSDEK
jgi:hypothetical protein